MEVSANYSTQPMEVSTSVERREDAVKVMFCPIPNLTTQKLQIPTYQGMLTLTLLSVRIERKLLVKVKASQTAFSRILVEVNHLRVRNLLMVNNLCVFN